MPGAGSPAACTMRSAGSLPAASQSVRTMMRSSPNSDGLSSSTSSVVVTSPPRRSVIGTDRPSGSPAVAAERRTAAMIASRARSMSSPSLPTITFTGAGIV